MHRARALFCVLLRCCCGGARAHAREPLNGVILNVGGNDCLGIHLSLGNRRDAELFTGLKPSVYCGKRIPLLLAFLFCYAVLFTIFACYYSGILVYLECCCASYQS